MLREVKVTRRRRRRRRRRNVIVVNVSLDFQIARSQYYYVATSAFTNIRALNFKLFVNYWSWIISCHTAGPLGVTVTGLGMIMDKLCSLSPHTSDLSFPIAMP